MGDGRDPVIWHNNSRPSVDSLEIVALSSPLSPAGPLRMAKRADRRPLHSVQVPTVPQVSIHSLPWLYVVVCNVYTEEECERYSVLEVDQEFRTQRDHLMPPLSASWYNVGLAWTPGSKGCSC
jgi:hypothetical protein